MRQEGEKGAAMCVATVRGSGSVPGTVPPGALPIVTLELRAASGLIWRELLWLVRCCGRDALWAAVEETPDRAAPVTVQQQQGLPGAAAGRLLADYLEATRAEVLAAAAASPLLAPAELAALLAERNARGG